MAVMIAIGGIYSLSSQRYVSESVTQSKAVTLADTMSVYRTAVVNYFLQNPTLTSTSASPDALQASNLLPAWFPAGDPGAKTWSNYRDATGIIYVFPADGTLPLPVNITSELTRVAYNSILAGTYSDTTGTLISPTGGNTNIPLSPLTSHASIQNGAPVWLAMIN